MSYLVCQDVLRRFPVPYEVAIQEKEDRVRAGVSGSRKPGAEFADSQGAWRQIFDACRTTGIPRAMVVADINGPLPTLPAYKIGTSLEASGGNRSIRIAYVELDEASRQDVHFAEIVAVNQGFSARVFETEEEARNWLLEP
jgi:hypothetical protein